MLWDSWNSPAERFPYKEEVTGSNPVAPTIIDKIETDIIKND